MSDGSKATGCLIIVVAALVLLMFALSSAMAQAPGHTHEGAVGAFYKKWMMPDNRGVSCCHDDDCGAAQSKMVNGEWYARWTDADDWVRIPDNKVERELDSPNAQSHMCGRKYAQAWSSGFTVFCFKPGSGS